MKRCALTFLAGVVPICGLASAAFAAPSFRVVSTAGDRTGGADVTAALIQRADNAKEPLEAFELRLVAANWVLARQLAPIASRRLLDIERDGDVAEGARLVAQAAGQLERASRIWQDKRNAEQLDEQARWTRSENLAALQAFAGAFGVLWPAKPVSAENTDDALREAAAKLTVLLEADKTEVAEAGMLWQAYIYGQRGDLDRARDLLPLVMKEMPRNDANAHLARLLRCRYVARRESGEAVAIALLARVEERCQDWFDAESERAARRSAALVRRQLLTAWVQECRKDGNSKDAAWCEEAIKRIDTETFAKAETADVLGLDHAAPLIVSEASPAGLPEAKAPTDAPGDEFDGS